MQVIRSQLWAAFHLNFAENLAKIVGPQADRQDFCLSQVVVSGSDGIPREAHTCGSWPTPGPRRGRERVRLI
jgi:hypothetical protein